MDDDERPVGGEIIDFFTHKRSKFDSERKYSRELAVEICETYSTSSKGLKTLCEAHEQWPHVTQIYYWRLQYPEFDQAMDLARTLRAQYLIDEAVEIADDDSKDVVNGDLNPVAVGRAKIRVETRLKWAQMMCPERYGTKADGIYRPPGYLPQDEAIKYLK